MSGIKFKGDTSGEILLETPAVAGTNTLTLPAETGTLATQNVVYNHLGMRNLIINGDMRIAQRGTGAFSGDTNFPVDRFRISLNQAGKFTAQQSTDVPTGQGFVNSIVLTSSSAYTEASGDYFLLQHRFEGNNVDQLHFGTANARTVTVSFWAKSSLTGTFAGALRDGGSYSTSYIFEYTISSADTWEYKTVTITGATSGTWLSGVNVGAELSWALGGGSGFDGTAGAWQSTNDFITSSANRLVGTSGATLYITGAQLEVGSTATPFEHLQYGQQLSLCERYYQIASASARYYSADGYWGLGYVHKVEMRDTPTIGTIFGGNNSLPSTFQGIIKANTNQTGVQWQGAVGTYYTYGSNLPLSAEL